MIIFGNFIDLWEFKFNHKNKKIKMNKTFKANQCHYRQKQFSNGSKILSPDWLTLGSTAATLESHHHLHSTLLETS